MSEISSGTVGRVILTVFIFVLFGPLIGGLVTIAGIAFSAAPTDPAAAGAMMLFMSIYGLWIAWPMGFIPAALVGLVIAIRDAMAGATWAFAFGVGSLAGIIFMLMGEIAEFQLLRLSFFGACLLATLVCFGLTRLFQRRRPDLPVAAA